jgi:hypothetical protein
MPLHGVSRQASPVSGRVNLSLVNLSDLSAWINDLGNRSDGEDE